MLFLFCKPFQSFLLKPPCCDFYIFQLLLLFLYFFFVVVLYILQLLCVLYFVVDFRNDLDFLMCVSVFSLFCYLLLLSLYNKCRLMAMLLTPSPSASPCLFDCCQAENMEKFVCFLTTIAVVANKERDKGLQILYFYQNLLYFIKFALKNY